MNKCMICNKKMIGGRALKTGYICKDCGKKIPEFIEINKLKEPSVKLLINNYEEIMLRIPGGFVPTCSYGKVSLDSLNGILRIENNPGYFDVTNVADFVLTPDYVESTKGRVLANVYLSMTLKNPAVDIIRYLIKPSDVCFPKGAKNSGEYTLPYGALLFLDEFWRTKERIKDHKDEVMAGEVLTKDKLKFIKAKALYMLPEGYTKKDVDLTKFALLEAFRGKGKDHEIESAGAFLISLLERETVDG